MKYFTDGETIAKEYEETVIARRFSEGNMLDPTKPQSEIINPKLINSLLGYQTPPILTRTNNILESPSLLGSQNKFGSRINLMTQSYLATQINLVNQNNVGIHSGLGSQYSLISQSNLGSQCSLGTNNPSALSLRQCILGMQTPPLTTSYLGMQTPPTNRILNLLTPLPHKIIENETPPTCSLIENPISYTHTSSVAPQNLIENPISYTHTSSVAPQNPKILYEHPDKSSKLDNVEMSASLVRRIPTGKVYCEL